MFKRNSLAWGGGSLCANDAFSAPYDIVAYNDSILETVNGLSLWRDTMQQCYINVWVLIRIHPRGRTGTS